jgi:hypothetical protein
MGITASQRQRQIERLALAGVIPAHDHSDILHTFADGWTIRTPTRRGDYTREGTLLVNCAADYAGVRPADIQVWDEAFSMADRADLDEQQRPYQLVSLRDEHNYPRALGWLLPGEYTLGWLGHGNDPLIETHEVRIDTWAMDERLYVLDRGVPGNRSGYRLGLICGAVIAAFVTLVIGLLWDLTLIARRKDRYWTRALTPRRLRTMWRVAALPALPGHAPRLRVVHHGGPGDAQLGARLARGERAAEAEAA